MTTLKQEAAKFRAEAARLRRDAAKAAERSVAADVFDNMADEIEAYLERDEDGEFVTEVDPDAPTLFGETA